MKTFLQIKILLTLFVLFLCYGPPLKSQTDWIKYEGNPVLEGEQNTWYEDIVVVKVIYEDNTFKMWFSASENAWSPGGEGHHIGYAESDDGLDWEVYEVPVISAGEDGSWNKSKWPGTIQRVNDTLKMWYSASSDAFNNVFSMGYAWSVEEHIWNLDTIPILGPGEPGSWDDNGVHHPEVYFDGSIYHMWYNGYTGGPFGPDQIGYATSFDGIHWEKDTLNNPVLQVQSSTFYSKWIHTGTVLYENEEYQMWFEGTNNALWRRFGYASSADGINWEIANDTILECGPELWDNWDMLYPSVLKQNGQYKMWYPGVCAGCDWKIGYATDVITSFTDNSTSHGVQYGISPNPFSKSVKLQINLDHQVYVECNLYDLSGKKVYEILNEKKLPGNHTVEIDGKILKPGIYFCTMKTIEGIQTQKIIKLD